MALERAVRLSFIVLVAGVFVAACGGDEPAPPAATSKAVPKSSPKAALPEPSVPEQLSARIDLPDYYPEDAPLYEGAQTSSVGWESGRVSAVFTTPDSPTDVSQGVQSNLRASGWEEIVAAEMVNGVVVQAGKDERGVSALISRMEDGSGDDVTMILVAVDP